MTPIPPQFAFVTAQRKARDCITNTVDAAPVVPTGGRGARGAGPHPCRHSKPRHECVGTRRYKFAPEKPLRQNVAPPEQNRTAPSPHSRFGWCGSHGLDGVPGEAHVPRMATHQVPERASFTVAETFKQMLAFMAGFIPATDTDPDQCFMMVPSPIIGAPDRKVTLAEAMDNAEIYMRAFDPQNAARLAIVGASAKPAAGADVQPLTNAESRA